MPLRLPTIQNGPTPRQILVVTLKILHLVWQTNPKGFAVIILAGLFNALLYPVVLYLDKLFIDTLVANIGATGNLNRAFSFLIFLVSARFVIGFARDFSLNISNYFDIKLSRDFYDRLRSLVAQKYNQIPVPILESADFRDKYRRVERDSLPRAYDLVSQALGIPLNFFGLVSAAAVFVFSYPLILFLGVIFSLPEFIFDKIYIQKRHHLRTQLEPILRVASWLAYYLLRPRGYLEQKLLGATGYMVGKFNELNAKYNQAMADFEKRGLVKREFFYLPYNLFTFGSEFFFAFLALTSAITIGTAQMFMRAISTLSDYMGSLVRSLIKHYENFVYVSDLIWILDLPVVNDRQRRLPFPSQLTTGIEFKNVWFKYPNTNRWVLKNISFVLRPKQNLAIIGENGAGKTTLVKLICNFYPPTKGEILIEGRPIAEYSQESIWENISVFFQDMETYPFSARESIGFGRISQIEDLATTRAYARQTGIDSWIMSLPLKYEHPLNLDMEKGVVPSMGQWQRIGLARTLIKNSPILILDEPTSNVDPQTEEKIFRNILRSGSEKILIFISHRFSTVRRADKIIVIENGAISESGSHDELMEKKGTYAKLFLLQAQNYQS